MTEENPDSNDDTQGDEENEEFIELEDEEVESAAVTESGLKISTGDSSPMTLQEIQDKVDEFDAGEEYSLSELLITMQADIGDMASSFKKLDALDEHQEQLTDKGEATERSIKIYKSQLESQLEGRIGSVIFTLAVIATKNERELEDIMQKTFERTEKTMEMYREAEQKMEDENQTSLEEHMDTDDDDDDDIPRIGGG